MDKKRRLISKEEAEFLDIYDGREPQEGKTGSRYMLTDEDYNKALIFRQENKLELKKQTKNKNGEVISETYSKRQKDDNIDASKFLPISFTTNPFGEGKWAKYDLPKEERLKNLRTAIDALKEEMKSMKTKMESLEEKVASLLDGPAAEPTILTPNEMTSKAKFSVFNVDGAANADRIKSAMAGLKNKKK